MTIKLRAKLYACASVLLLAGCMDTQTVSEESPPTEQDVTSISQMGELPSGASTSLRADPNQAGLIERLSGSDKTRATVPAGPAPFGETVKACGVSKKTMGKKIDGFPSKSPKVFLYDSNPKTKAPHDFYLTGLKDNCPRRFTAAVAMFGDLQLHEIMRYEMSAKSTPYTETDLAYEMLKGRKCGVKAGVACGDKRMKSFSKSTGLLTVYEKFGDGGDWGDILLHNRAIYASSVR